MSNQGTFDLEKGKGSFLLPLLNKGSYIFQLLQNKLGIGNSKLPCKIIGRNVNIKLLDDNDKETNRKNITYDTETNFKIKVTNEVAKPISGDVVVTVDGEKLGDITVTNGTGTLKITSSIPVTIGSHDLRFKYTDPKGVYDTTTVKYALFCQGTVFNNMPALPATHEGNKVTLISQLTDIKGNPVVDVEGIFKINGESTDKLTGEKFKTDGKGEMKYEYTVPDPCNVQDITIESVYTPNNELSIPSTSTELHVVRDTHFDETYVKQIEMVSNTNVTIKQRLVDSHDKPVADNPCIFKVNGVTQTNPDTNGTYYKTDSNGILTINAKFSGSAGESFPVEFKSTANEHYTQAVCATKIVFVRQLSGSKLGAGDGDEEEDETNTRVSSSPYISITEVSESPYDEGTIAIYGKTYNMDDVGNLGLYVDDNLKTTFPIKSDHSFVVTWDFPDNDTDELHIKNLPSDSGYNIDLTIEVEKPEAKPEEISKTPTTISLSKDFPDEIIEGSYVFMSGGVQGVTRAVLRLYEDGILKPYARSQFLSQHLFGFLFTPSTSGLHTYTIVYDGDDTHESCTYTKQVNVIGISGNIHPVDLTSLDSFEIISDDESSSEITNYGIRTGSDYLVYPTSVDGDFAITVRLASEHKIEMLLTGTSDNTSNPYLHLKNNQFTTRPDRLSPSTISILESFDGSTYALDNINYTTYTLIKEENTVTLYQNWKKVATGYIEVDKFYLMFTNTSYLNDLEIYTTPIEESFGYSDEMSEDGLPAPVEYQYEEVPVIPEDSEEVFINPEEDEEE